MSILQELEIANNQLDSDTRQKLDVYLATHPDLLLSDVYYNENEWKKFEKWSRQYDQVKESKER